MKQTFAANGFRPSTFASGTWAGPKSGPRMAVIVEIAEAVLEVLNAASLSQSFTAERAYVPVHEQESFDILQVTVVAPEIAVIVPLTRGSDNFDYVINIGVQKRIGKGQMDNDAINAACDPLMLLTEEITDLFRMVSLSGYTTASNIATANVPAYVPEHLDAHRVFTSVVTLTYRKARAR